MEKWFGARYRLFNQNDVLEHATSLGSIASWMRALVKNECPGSVVETLFDAFTRARHFIHFSTFGISLTFIGALKLAAQSVDIRGIVSNPSSFCLSELTEFPDEAPRFKAHVFGTSNPIRDVPHQKLIVIDGLLAFKGSVNLTVEGWRKVEKGLDMLEVVTDVQEVVSLHNSYLSPIWATVNSEVTSPILME